MNTLQRDELILRLAIHETLFLNYQKGPKVKIARSYSKEGDLYRLQDFR